MYNEGILSGALKNMPFPGQQRSAYVSHDKDIKCTWTAERVCVRERESLSVIVQYMCLCVYFALHVPEYLWKRVYSASPY